MPSLHLAISIVKEFLSHPMGRAFFGEGGWTGFLVALIVFCVNKCIISV